MATRTPPTLTVPALKGRKPTGKASWPLGLATGIEKSGKTYAAAEASASDLIGQTFWLSYGETDADEYGALPGADYTILEHDGTYRSVLNAIDIAVRQPKVGGKPNLIIGDSWTKLWARFSDSAQQAANERRDRKNKTSSDEEAQVTADLWNIAKDRWKHILDTLATNDGPVILNTRLELVTVFDATGKPTKEKIWKVQAEKNLPFDADLVVQMRAFGENYLTGVKSLRYQRTPNEYTRLPDMLSWDTMWRQLGLADDKNIGPRSRSTAPAAQSFAAEDAVVSTLLTQIAEAAQAAGVAPHVVAAQWADEHNGQSITDATDVGSLEILRDDLRVKIPAAATPEPDQAPAADPNVNTPGPCQFVRRGDHAKCILPEGHDGDCAYPPVEGEPPVAAEPVGLTEDTPAQKMADSATELLATFPTNSAGLRGIGNEAWKAGLLNDPVVGSNEDGEDVNATLNAYIKTLVLRAEAAAMAAEQTAELAAEVNA